MDIQNDENQGEKIGKRKKRKKKLKPFYKIKPHRNPLCDGDWICPLSPKFVDWNVHYPSYFKPPHERLKNESNNTCNDGTLKLVEMADVGCGYGGLLFSLSQQFPNTLILGMEIRTKVVEYVETKIIEQRNENPGNYQNISVLNTNAMKFLPNFFFKAQLKKIFFLFPDPHFKKANHRRRIISKALLAEYAYALEIGGLCYTVTDVEDLFEWMTKHLTEHPLFERVSEKDMNNDPVVPLILTSSEEAKKVEKEDGKKICCSIQKNRK